MAPTGRGPSSDAPLDAPRDLPRDVLASLHEGCIVLDFDLRFLYVNPAAARQTRCAPETLLGRTFPEAFPALESTELLAALRRSLRTREPERLKHEYAYGDGTTCWFELRFEPVPQGLALLSLDCSEGERAERAEARVSHLNAVLRGIRDVNQLICRERDPQRLIEQASELLVASRGYATCTFALVAEGRLVHAALAGSEAKLLGLRRLIAAGRLPDCVVRALGRPDPEVVGDPPTACPDCPVNEGFHTGRDAVVVRLEHEGSVYGALLVSVAPGSGGGTGAGADPEELSLLREVAGDVAFALKTFEVEAQRARAAEDVRRTAERLESLAQVVRELSRVRNLAGITEIVRTAARSLVGADGATFVLRDGDLCHYVDEDAVEPLWKGRRFPLHQCVSGWAMLHDEPAVIPDVYADVRIPQDAYRPTFVRSLAIVPIRRGAPTGAIGTYWARPYRVTDGELRVLRALADAAAVALENVAVYEELERSESRYRNLVENLDEVVFALDDRGCFTYASAAAGRLGFEPGVLLGRSLASLAHREDVAPLEARLAGSLAGSVEPHEFRLACPDGKVRHVRASFHRVAEEGRSPTVRGVLFDVTGQREVEDQLRQAQKMEAVGRLAGGVAHDFNNILSAILGFADFALEEAPQGSPVCGDLLEIRAAAERAAALTKQLLAFSRKQVLQPRVLDLNAVVEGLLGMLRRLLGEDVTLTTDLAEGLGRVRADPGQLEQVLMNLSLNARDAMLKGGRLTLGTANLELDQAFASRQGTLAPGSYVVLSVADTGAGMDEEVRARIFEPFFTTKPQGKGTGLGLPTVYGIVRQSGGDVWVYSEPGKGSTFKVCLPRVDAAPEPAPEPGSPTLRARPGEVVLLVEDDEALRGLTRRILEGAGYVVLSAADGADALRALEHYQGRLDLLLTDVVMPEMSGRDLANRLRTLRPPVRVLYMSGYTDEAISHHGVLDPGVLLLPKPFGAAALTRAVRSALDQAE